MANVDLLINGELSITQGALNNLSNRNINLKGNFTNNNGIGGFTAGTGTFNLTGANQTISGGTQFTRLTLNGAGVKTLNASINVNTALVLTAGILSTGLNQINLTNTATVTGGSAASHINGNLQKGIGTATSLKQFEIGDGSVYTPVTINFSGTTNNTGNLIVSTTNGVHPNILSTSLDPNKAVNRFYNIINNGVSGFTAAAATFGFNASDLDAGTNTSNFVVGRFAGTWSSPAVGVRTSSSTQVTGLTAFGAFQIAEEYVGGLAWNGTVSADWNNAANWTPNFVPGLSDDVTINPGTFQPTFLSAGSGSCRDITFTTGTNLNVPTGFTLTVAGNWLGVNTTVGGQGTVRFTSPAAVHSGNTTFSGVLSVASGANLNTGDGITLKNNASLMHGAGTAGAGGNVSGRIVVQRAGQTSSTSYNYWSSPISNGTVASLGGNRYFYNPNGATANDFEGLRQGWSAASGAMTVGRGYAATGTANANFNGFANNGNLSFGPTALGTHTAFNLVGNPYPSAISASAFVAANPNITGLALYFWDDDGSAGAGFNAAQDYAVWNNLGVVSGPNSGTSFTGNIASCQSFFIEATASSLIQFNNGMRTSANNAFFVDEAVQRLWISVTTEVNDYNETLIAFRNDATEGIDAQYDAKKFRGNEHLALYSKSANTDLAIQAIPELNTDRIVQLGLEADLAGPQTLRLKQADNLPENAQVILEDTKLGVFQNLQNNPVYHFNYAGNEDVARFRLHFMPGVFMSASSESCAQNDGSIQLSSPSETTWNYSIANAEGTIVASGSDFSGNTSVNNLAGGSYMVSMSNAFGSNIEQTLNIAAGQAVSASLQASATEVIASQTAVSFSGTASGAIDYTWNFGDGSSVSGILNPLHVYSQPGVYTATFIASNSTCIDIETIEIRVSAAATGIASQKAEVFSIFPNPAEDFTLVQLNLPEAESSLRFDVLDMSGRVVMSRTYNQVGKETQLEIDLSSIKSGVYQLLVRGEKFSTASRFTKAD
jgi:hypothetical protein